MVMTIRSMAARLTGLPLWVWAIGLIPWIWIIPFNQGFWDDWKAPVTGWQDQISRWEGGGKHYLNPLLFFLLVPIGPWAFHILMVGSLLVSALSLTRIACRISVIPSQVASWVGVFCLAMPVFHARFTGVVVEYYLALAALLLGWAILIERSSFAAKAVAASLLVFAIGVPSLAILYPLVWLHTGGLQANTLTGMRHQAVKNSWILLIPIIYVFVFQAFLNTGSVYGPSVGAILAFLRGLLAITVIGLLGFVLASRLDPARLTSWKSVIASGAATYAAFFPYYAVGYNPIQDFLPWRMRSAVTDTFISRFIAFIGAYLFLGFLVYLLFGIKGARRTPGSAVLVLLIAAVFSAVMTVLGPMDWESRHWLIAWPLLAIFFGCLTTLTPLSVRNRTACGVFVILVASSSVISSEFLVDALKQRAITKASQMEVARMAVGRMSVTETVYLVVVDTPSSSNLNARYRSFRPFEWWGLLSKGLRLSPEQVQILEPSDIDSHDPRMCDTQLRAIEIKPEVLSGWVESLVQFEVAVRLNPSEIDVCVSEVRNGWPRRVLDQNQP
jgi:hypothetical protein